MKYNIYSYTVGKNQVVNCLAKDLTNDEKDSFLKGEVCKKEKEKFKDKNIEVFIDAVPVNSLADKDFQIKYN